jgi:hypothetical protein
MIEVVSIEEGVKPMSSQRHVDLSSMPAVDERLEYVSPGVTEVKLENPVSGDLFEAARLAFFGAKMVAVGAGLFPTSFKSRNDPS